MLLAMSRSTVRTIMLAPAARSTCTHARSPIAAAICSAVRPFSARLSTYLPGTLSHPTSPRAGGTHSTLVIRAAMKGG
jgi:hypothetical protein